MGHWRLFYLQLITVDMDKASMDKFVFAIAHKKVASKLHKDMLDLVCIFNVSHFRYVMLVDLGS